MFKIMSATKDFILNKILGYLVDRYENSRTFIGDNKTRQTFRVYISKVLPKYADDSEYTFYQDVNLALAEIETTGIVVLKKERNGRIEYAELRIENIEKAYLCLKRKSKSEKNNEILLLFAEFENLDKEIYAPLLWHIIRQKQCLKENKKTQFTDDGIENYRDILTAAKAVLENRAEILIREMSVRLFNNSKRLEEIESQVRTLLFNSGESCGRPYDGRETVFEEHDILKMPSYIMLKGKGILHCGQDIDLAKIGGDIGLSSNTLKSLEYTDLQGADVITVENLTSFYRYECKNEMAIYLGGFHNSVKRQFIKMLSEHNPKSVFHHYGDIDAGGFYILEHLKAKTGISFQPFRMDIAELERCRSHWLPLTENDRRRIHSILAKNPPYSAVLQYMLDNNCKLEQEAGLL